MRQNPSQAPAQGPSIWSWLGRITDYFSWPLRTYHYLELVTPLWNADVPRAKVVDVWDETKDSRTITLRPGPNWRGHRAGQHIRIGIPVDGKHYTRTYTISSPPERDDNRFTITVKAIDNGRVSHHLVRNVQVGDYFRIGLPQGEFYLPDAQHVSPLFITAGSGITPAISMIRSLIAQDRLPDTQHIHYAPHEFDVVLGKDLKKMDREHERYHLHLVYTRDKEGDNRHFTEVQLDEFCPDWRERDVYACGPPVLLEALEECFEKAGRSRYLHIERFRAAFAEVPKDAVGGRVRFSQSGTEVDADSNTPLLHVAEESGLNPPNGCRMGICHTCNTTLLSGCVRDLRNGQLINEEGSTVQTCICAAASDCELDL
ncbi:MAG: ferredoxin reductase [Pseudomonadota bacterium]